MGTRMHHAITKTTLAGMTYRCGQNPICRICRGKIKVGDRLVSMQRISKRTAWFRKYIHEECYEKTYSTFQPLLLNKT